MERKGQENDFERNRPTAGEMKSGSETVCSEALSGA